MFKYPEELKRIDRPRLLVVCYAVTFLVAKLVAVLVIIWDLTPALILPDFCTLQSDPCAPHANESAAGVSAANESSCALVHGCANSTGGSHCCRGEYGVLGDEKVFVSGMLLGVVALVYLNNEVRRTPHPLLPSRA